MFRKNTTKYWKNPEKFRIFGKKSCFYQMSQKYTLSSKSPHFQMIQLIGWLILLFTHQRSHHQLALRKPTIDYSWMITTYDKCRHSQDMMNWVAMHMMPLNTWFSSNEFQYQWLAFHCFPFDPFRNGIFNRDSKNKLAASHKNWSNFSGKMITTFRWNERSRLKYKDFLIMWNLSMW